jgi:hypothetical protein
VLIASDLRGKSEAAYNANGGEEIALPAEEQSLFLQTIAVSARMFPNQTRSSRRPIKS